MIVVVAAAAVVQCLVPPFGAFKFVFYFLQDLLSGHRLGDSPVNRITFK